MQSSGKKHKYFIYSHSDTDGGIAAAMISRHIGKTYGSFGWECEVFPVSHGGTKSDWTVREIQWPCAILDFSLHPKLFDNRFLQQREALAQKLGGEDKVPPCLWFDHHPTGANYTFLTPENAQGFFGPHVKSLWDITAVSTPGLLRKHFEKLNLSRELIKTYEDYIDLAEIIDGALYATPAAAHDFSNMAIRLQTLFNPSHPLIDGNAIYKFLVKHISEDPNPESIFDADPIFASLIKYEQTLYSRRLQQYQRTAKLVESVVVSNFFYETQFEGIGRFIPFVLYPDAKYAIHVFPRHRGSATVSCGINPWNKPQSNEKHLGNYFAKHFDGGGHSFVAGGRVPEDQLDKLEALVKFILDA